MPKPEVIYATWRTDKAKEPGFSHELISTDTMDILDKTNLDSLEVLPGVGIDTLYKAFQANLKKMPDNKFLGTRVGNTYEWMSFSEVGEMAENISFGYLALGLVPSIQAEDKDWKFMGIQSKNRKEWYICHLANMYQSVTTVAFYDTLGPEATKFVCNQTQLITMAVSNDYISKIAKMKIEEDKSGEETQMHRVKNLVVFDDMISQEE